MQCDLRDPRKQFLSRRLDWHDKECLLRQDDRDDQQNLEVVRSENVYSVQRFLFLIQFGKAVIPALYVHLTTVRTVRVCVQSEIHFRFNFRYVKLIVCKFYCL